MAIDPKKIARLKRLVEMTDSFTQIVAIEKKLNERLDKEIISEKKQLDDLVKEFKEVIHKAKSEMSDTFTGVRQKTVEAIDRLIARSDVNKRLQGKLDEANAIFARIDEKLSKVRNGKDADENAVIEAVLGRIELPRDGERGEKGEKGDPGKDGDSFDPQGFDKLREELLEKISQELSRLRRRGGSIGDASVLQSIQRLGLLIGANISVDTTNFDNNLSSADDTVQKALETLDELVGGGATDHGALTGLSDDDHTQYLLAAGTRTLSADWDAGSHQIRAETFQSDIATGTAPLTVASTTKVTNLNADLLDDQTGSYYLDSANFTGTNWTDLTDSGSTIIHNHGTGTSTKVPKWNGTAGLLQDSNITDSGTLITLGVNTRFPTSDESSGLLFGLNGDAKIYHTDTTGNQEKLVISPRFDGGAGYVQVGDLISNNAPNEANDNLTSMKVITDSSGNARAGLFVAEYSVASTATANNMVGINAGAIFTNTGGSTNTSAAGNTAGRYFIRSTAANTLAKSSALSAQTTFTTGTLTEGALLRLEPFTVTTGTITNAYGLKYEGASKSTTGTFTNYYGAYFPYVAEGGATTPTNYYSIMLVRNTAGFAPFATTSIHFGEKATRIFSPDTNDLQIAATDLNVNVTNLGFYNVTPVARATTAGGAATFAANTSGISDDTATWDSYTIGQIVKALRDVGILT